MSIAKTGDWYDRDKKREAIVKVLRYVADNPEKGMECVGNDEKAHALFREIGNIEIPKEEGGRAIFFAPGEKKLEPGSSVIIELPAAGSNTGATDNDLLKYVLGNYVHWGS
jgi:hypothetical protein